MKTVLNSMMAITIILVGVNAHAEDGGERVLRLGQTKESLTLDQKKNQGSLMRDLYAGDANGVASLEPLASDDELAQVCEPIIRNNGEYADECLQRVQTGQYNRYALAACNNYAINAFNANWNPNVVLYCLDTIQGKAYAQSALRVAFAIQEKLASYGAATALYPQNFEDTNSFLRTSAERDYQAEAIDVCMGAVDPLANAWYEQRGYPLTLVISSCLEATGDRVYENLALLKSCSYAKVGDIRSCLDVLRSQPNERLKSRLAQRSAQEAAQRAADLKKQRQAQAQEEREAHQRAAAEEKANQQREWKRCAKAKVFVGIGKLGTDNRPCP